MEKTVLQSFILGAVFAASPLYAGVPTTTVMPQPLPVAVSPFDGFYVGAGVDLVGPHEKITTDLINKLLIDPSLYVYQQLQGKNSGIYQVGGSLFAGYGKTFENQTYLGLEIFGHYYDADVDIQLNAGSSTLGLTGMQKTHINHPYSYGLDLRGGYLITPQTMFYILFGAELSKFEVKSTTEFLLEPDILPPTDKFNKNAIGCTPGLGLETFINQNFSIRVQGTYTFYQSFKHEGEAEIVSSSLTSVNQGETTLQLVTKVEPSRAMFSLMLSYYFG